MTFNFNEKEIIFCTMLLYFHRCVYHAHKVDRVCWALGCRIFRVLIDIKNFYFMIITLLMTFRYNYANKRHKLDLYISMNCKECHPQKNTFKHGLHNIRVTFIEYAIANCVIFIGLGLFVLVYYKKYDLYSWIIYMAW